MYRLIEGDILHSQRPHGNACTRAITACALTLRCLLRASFATWLEQEPNTNRARQQSEMPHRFEMASPSREIFPRLFPLSQKEHLYQNLLRPCKTRKKAASCPHHTLASSGIDSQSYPFSSKASASSGPPVRTIFPSRITCT